MFPYVPHRLDPLFYRYGYEEYSDCVLSACADQDVVFAAMIDTTKGPVKGVVPELVNFALPGEVQAEVGRKGRPIPHLDSQMRTRRFAGKTGCPNMRHG